MKNVYVLILLICISAAAQAGESEGNIPLVINEVVCGATNGDWVELKLRSTGKESMDISNLYITMYYGTNENLAAEPVTIYSYDRPETIYDDRFVVVHLTEPSTPDETDATGDTNGNGVVDLYCD
ncbi:MAG: hypothetical protein GY754_47355, partial [bacterium]|nr:hypothetical protein [bacterium]